MTNHLVQFFVFIALVQNLSSLADAKLDQCRYNIRLETYPLESTCSLDGERGMYSSAEWKQSCSFNNSELDDMIDAQLYSNNQTINKTVTEPKNLPFMATVYERVVVHKCYDFIQNGTLNQTCTDSIEHHPVGVAAIIHPQILVTTAHVFYHSNASIFVVGSGSDNMKQQQITHVERVAIHPLYEGSDIVYDIAVVQLTTSLNDSHIPMCMCLENGKLNPKMYGLQMSVAGWRVILELHDAFRAKLLREKVRFDRMTWCCHVHKMELSKCYGSSPNRQFDNFACVKVSKKRSCNSKVGQILYQNLPRGNVALRGISVNTGFNCDNKIHYNTPLMIVDIRLHHSWILKRMHEILTGEAAFFTSFRNNKVINDTELIFPYGSEIL